jgi:hypothetical protein
VYFLAESTLLVCKNDSQACQTKKAQPGGKPIGVPVIKSQGTRFAPSQIWFLCSVFLFVVFVKNVDSASKYNRDTGAKISFMLLGHPQIFSKFVTRGFIFSFSSKFSSEQVHRVELWPFQFKGS